MVIRLESFKLWINNISNIYCNFTLKTVKNVKMYFYPQRYKIKCSKYLVRNNLCFPSLTVLWPKGRKKLKLKKSNGGWGDRRDHQMCANFTHS